MVMHIHLSASRLTTDALRIAAVGFTLAWVLGLAIPVPATDLDAPGHAVSAALAGHELAFAARALLVHGLAAVALVTVAASLGRRARIAGLVAAALSAVQWMLESALAAGGSGSLLEAVNRIDGVKMVALAALVLTGSHLLPRWLRAVGAILVPALIISAAGYLALVTSLAVAAFVSLPLLLIWVTGAGLAQAR
jgi:hypothetical protein